MCGYVGRHFGAGYPDGACSEGVLYDLDGDGPSSADSTPCPRCSTEAWLDSAAESARSCGCSNGEAWCGAMVIEAALQLAEEENPAEATAWKRAKGSIVVADWPDRQAVLDGRAAWNRTIDVTMAFETEQETGR